MAVIMSAAEAVKQIHDGNALIFGGFRDFGPTAVIDELVKNGTKDLTVIRNDGARVGQGVGKLIERGQVKSLICTFCGDIPLAGELSDAGKMNLEFNPQGTFIERIRAGGYGLGGVLTPSGLGTLIEEKWASRLHLDGRDWLYHTPLRGNVTIVEADTVDMAGNLKFHLTQRSFSTSMCFASDIVIVETKNPVLKIGALDPEEIDVPGILIDIIIETGAGEK